METFPNNNDAYDPLDTQAAYGQAYHNLGEEDLQRIAETTSNDEERAAVQRLLDEMRDRRRQKEAMAVQAASDQAVEAGRRGEELSEIERIRRQLAA